MKHRDFLGLALGLVAGAAMLAGSAQAAPLPPAPAQATVTTGAKVEPAVVSQSEVDHLKPQQVHWHHGGWHHHHWHHRHWHHHHWHRHWHHHHW